VTTDRAPDSREPVLEPIRRCVRGEGRWSKSSSGRARAARAEQRSAQGTTTGARERRRRDSAGMRRQSMSQAIEGDLVRLAATTSRRAPRRRTLASAIEHWLLGEVLERAGRASRCMRPRAGGRPASIVPAHRDDASTISETASTCAPFAADHASDSRS